MLDNFKHTLCCITVGLLCCCSVQEEGGSTGKPSVKCDRVVMFKGGMGNQFFQYSLGYIIEMETGKQVCYDKSSVIANENSMHSMYQLDNYNIGNILSIEDEKDVRFYRKKYKFVREYKHSYKFDKNDKVLNPDKGFGYYEYPLYFSEKYFKKYRTSIMNKLTLKVPLDEKNQQILNQIKKTKNSVAIHIRRGDYLQPQHINFYVTTIDNYYKKAIEIFKNMPDVHYFIFSNDPEWVKKNLKTGKPTTYVDINDERHGYFDFELMRNCKHKIITNSTFSLWAAYLSEDTDGIVVSPKYGYRCPSSKETESCAERYLERLFSDWKVIDNFAEKMLFQVIAKPKANEKQKPNNKKTSQ